MSSLFTWPVRVYYEDTDAGGVVYYANYLKFLERARTEWLRAHGIEQDHLREREQRIFVVRRICVEYHRPARFNDLLEVTLDLGELKRASVTVLQAIQLASGTHLCSAEVQLACVHSESLKAQALPAAFVAACTNG